MRLPYYLWIICLITLTWCFGWCFDCGLLFDFWFDWCCCFRVVIVASLFLWGYGFCLVLFCLVDSGLLLAWLICLCYDVFVLSVWVYYLVFIFLGLDLLVCVLVPLACCWLVLGVFVSWLTVDLAVIRLCRWVLSWLIFVLFIGYLFCLLYFDLLAASGYLVCGLLRLLCVFSLGLVVLFCLLIWLIKFDVI